jgi:hypothetical protein
MILKINNNLYYNKMTDNLLLNKSFDITEELIKKNPDKEDAIINDFNNYIIKVKSNSPNNNSIVRSSTFKDDEITNHNGIIKIHNNFQRYDNSNNANSDSGYGPLLSRSSPPPPSSPPETFKDYYKNFMNSGFKDYLKI